jgi:hypothetical protein
MLSATYGHEAHLYWYQGRYSKKIKLDRMLVNVATLYTIVDYCGYRAFCQDCQKSENDPALGEN